MKQKNVIGLLVGVLVLFVIYKIVARTQERKNGGNGNDILPEIQGDNGNSVSCTNPSFADVDISGNVCAGTEINESKMLRLGNQGCDVLLLQQRLNGIENNVDVLEPNGQFNCKTLNKLKKLRGVNSISLNGFQPDEQIGFNELEAGKRV